MPFLMAETLIIKERHERIATGVIRGQTKKKTKKKNKETNPKFLEFMTLSDRTMSWT